MSSCRYDGLVVVRTLYVSDRSLYSIVFSQWRECKMGVT